MMASEELDFAGESNVFGVELEARVVPSKLNSAVPIVFARLDRATCVTCRACRRTKIDRPPLREPRMKNGVDNHSLP